jgi:hypothetical protein
MEQLRRDRAEAGTTDLQSRANTTGRKDLLAGKLARVEPGLSIRPCPQLGRERDCRFLRKPLPQHFGPLMEVIDYYVVLPARTAFAIWVGLSWLLVWQVGSRVAAHERRRFGRF